MISHIFTTLSILLPTLLAYPVGETQTASEYCTPQTYTISSFTFTTGVDASLPTVDFEFNPGFISPALVTDPAINGASCSGKGATLDTFPNENECDTGRENLIWDLTQRVDKAEFHIVHQWKCDGRSYMSSTSHKIDPLDCNTAEDGSLSCSSPTNTFVPQNVRQICSAPTCP
ncbi:hypothetical protein P280DRAFT_106960 [Massarina eburnea CBS 473.64]|uniref:AA1-like domain-containing protein n=1 Tax=Massarina eburnea CBS 473.64 TaxID=1395130 RepID=A0A6A6RTY5_9PLEO|nr:hypothetical protein P280DRAFT_106960 [Massarina eburnea CBS 473.64]